MKQLVAVVIPIYRPQPTASELLSLQQAQRVLGHYPMIFLCANSFDASPYLSHIPQANLARFEDQYFSSVTGYSQLLLSAHFYQQFNAYHYVLIYQLDAYVFRDELAYWCQKGYDYVGAPWIEPPPVAGNAKPKVNIQSWFVGKVGNGGLCLRQVKSHERNARFFRPILRFFTKNEDMFWGLALYWLNPFFKRPNWQEALHFAFELNPRKSFELTNHQLPFGVHAWEKYDKEFWKQWIK